MLFSLYPDIPAGAAGDIIMEIGGCDPEKITEVHIYREDRALGIKRFRGQGSYQVNVACYLRDTLDITPYYTARYCGYRDLTSRRMGTFHLRATEYEPSQSAPPYGIGWIRSDEVQYTEGKVVCEPFRFLIDMDTDLEICSGESIELPLLLPYGRLWSTLRIIGPGWSTFMTLNNNEDERDRMFSYYIHTSYVEEAIEYVLDEKCELEITIGAYDHDFETIKRIAVREMPEKGVRMCWMNKYGCIDYYTFSPVYTAGSVTSKTKVRGSGGYMTAAVQKQSTYTVRTPYTTPEVLLSLTGMLSSPRVWHIENGVTYPVDILTEKTSTSFETPVFMEVTYRYCL